MTRTANGLIFFGGGCLLSIAVLSVESGQGMDLVGPAFIRILVVLGAVAAVLGGIVGIIRRSGNQSEFAATLTVERAFAFGFGLLFPAALVYLQSAEIVDQTQADGAASAGELLLPFVGVLIMAAGFGKWLVQSSRPQ